ncbi:hypothetical protein HU200_055992 [Digitaria exilis]|uniref:RING-type domain-containing protein n=1 Tax=Digitaria exilis TaxID=1010633 RepID=A0A835E107_9POAL|nr:hypothetical protein HU200_055992 [Digitaria exilis]
MAGSQCVNVWAEVGQEKRAIGELSSMKPDVAVPPVVLSGEFVLRHDLAVAAAVRLHYRVLDPSSAATSCDVVQEQQEERFLVLGDHDEDDDQEETDDDYDDSDDEGGFGVPLLAAPAAPTLDVCIFTSVSPFPRPQQPRNPADLALRHAAIILTKDQLESVVRVKAGAVVKSSNPDLLRPPHHHCDDNAREPRHTHRWTPLNASRNTARGGLTTLRQAKLLLASSSDDVLHRAPAAIHCKPSRPAMPVLQAPFFDTVPHRTDNCQATLAAMAKMGLPIDASNKEACTRPASHLHVVTFQPHLHRGMTLAAGGARPIREKGEQRRGRSRLAATSRMPRPPPAAAPAASRSPAFTGLDDDAPPRRRHHVPPSMGNWPVSLDINLPAHKSGFLHMSSPEDGRFLCITRLSLSDPAMAGGQCVNIWAEVGQEKRAIGELSSTKPDVAVPPVVLGGEFVLRHDLAVAAAVRLHYSVLDPKNNRRRGFVLGDHDEDDDQEETDDDDDSDDEGGFGVPLFAAPAGSVVVPDDGEFLGPARFAAVENAAAFMRVAAAAASSETNAGGGESKEIVVLYRYTRFSTTTRGGVEPCRRTKLHRLRFVVAHSGDMASSLAMAGSSLGPLIYPGLFRQQLHDLWKSLVAPPAMETIPPGATRLHVVVDAGILRREDYSPERMAHVHGALATRILDAWPPEYYHVGMELHLPEAVTASRRIGEGEEEEDDECCVSFELLKSGMAAWPGCGHVFHGACLEKALERSQTCPLCRRKLSDPIAQ